MKSLVIALAVLATFTSIPPAKAEFRLGSPDDLATRSVHFDYALNVFSTIFTTLYSKDTQLQASIACVDKIFGVPHLRVRLFTRSGQPVRSGYFNVSSGAACEQLAKTLFESPASFQFMFSENEKGEMKIVPVKQANTEIN